MVIVSPTTMSPVVKYISGCGPLSQVSQLSQPEITLPVTASLECRTVCPNVPSVATVPTIPSCFTSAAQKFIASCKVSASFRPLPPRILTRGTHYTHYTHYTYYTMLTRSLRHSNWLYFSCASWRARVHSEELNSPGTNFSCNAVLNPLRKACATSSHVACGTNVCRGVVFVW